jgi:hypothetical protein
MCLPPTRIGWAELLTAHRGAGGLGGGGEPGGWPSQRWSPGGSPQFVICTLIDGYSDPIPTKSPLPPFGHTIQTSRARRRPLLPSPFPENHRKRLSTLANKGGMRLCKSHPGYVRHRCIRMREARQSERQPCDDIIRGKCIPPPQQMRIVFARSFCAPASDEIPPPQLHLRIPCGDASAPIGIGGAFDGTIRLGPGIEDATER